jgi:hypothetical protein
VAEQSQVPDNADADPREAGFGPGERGDSIEEGRQGKEGEQVPDNADADPREAGFGPGERGDSIEEGRQGKEGDDAGVG